MTKTEEQQLLRNIKKIALSAERIAKALERLVSPIPSAEEYVYYGEQISNGMASVLEDDGR
jgi:hypothetical protein